MITIPELRPMIYWKALPENEQTNARLIQTKFSELASFIERFEADVALYDFSEGEIHKARLARKTAADAGQPDPGGAHFTFASLIKPMVQWMQIAGRDAALTLYDFRAALYALQTRLLASPTLINWLDKGELHETCGLFHKYFPDVKDARHGAAHPADISNTPERNAMKGDFELPGSLRVEGGENVMVSGVVGREVIVTIEHQIVKVSLSQDTVQKLQEIDSKIASLLKRASQETKDALFRATYGKDRT